MNVVRKTENGQCKEMVVKKIQKELYRTILNLEFTIIVCLFSIVISGFLLFYVYSFTADDLIKLGLNWIFGGSITIIIVDLFIKKIITQFIPNNNSKYVTYKFPRISDKKAKEKIIKFINNQLKKKRYKTDIFTISKSLNIPLRQVARIIKPKTLNNK